MNRTYTIVIAAGVLSTAIASCAVDDPNRRAKEGAVIGAIGGAVIGHQVDGRDGRLLGGVIGGLLGATVGNYQDQQQRELEEALAAEQRARQVEIQRMQDETLKVSLSNEASFAFDSDEIRAAFYPTLNKLGETMTKYDQTILHVVGHTDSVGSESYNLDLSRRRASNVVSYLSSVGVDSARLRVIGAGESEPRAPNDTAASRARNRRVEIFIKPVVQGQESEALTRPYS